MKNSFRRIGAAAAALIASIGVGVGGAPPPAGALQGADTTTLAQHRCIARLSYPVFLDRDATEEEKSDWADAFATGTPYADLPDELANSDEWLGKVVTDLYQLALERNPSAGDIAYWGGQLESGVKVNTVGASIFGSNEFFVNKAGSNNTTYVEELFERILQRTSPPPSGDVAYWVGEIPSRTRGGVASAFYGTTESRGIRVEALYQQILGRAADAPGKTYWVGQLATINDIQAAVELASLSEFRTRSHNLCNPTIGTYYPITLGTPLELASNPAYTMPNVTMDTAMALSGTGCIIPTGASTTGETVLLVAAPGDSADQWRSDLASAGRLAGLRRVCRVELPGALTSTDTWDATRSAQYVARAVHRIAFFYGGTVDIVADGLGGLTTRWALRWWPTFRQYVDDVVTIGTPNHGSVDTMYDATTTPTPFSQQSRADSVFIKALNSNDETPGSTTTYTNIASGSDHQSVGDGDRDQREYAWQLNGATNIRVQNSCPTLDLKRTGVRDHAWVWAAVKDALTNTGGTSTTRLASTPCGSNAGTDGSASLGTTVARNSEPPLPDYVPTADPETPPHAALGLPTSDPGNASRVLNEPPADLAAAKVCPGGADARYAQSPTLLVPGGIHTDTGQMYDAFKSRFATSGTYPVCWVNVPDGASGSPLALDPTKAGANLLRSPQYVVQATRELITTYGVDVDLIGHSRGGFDIAWAVKWWPDMQTGVDDVIIVDTPLRGSGMQRYATPATYPLMAIPGGHQSRSDAKFIAALRVDDPTPGPATWTTISTWDDDGSAANRHLEYDTRQTAYRWPGASNVVLQQHCAGTAADHGQVLTGNMGWAVISDALNNAGGADPSRFMTSGAVTCDDDWRVFEPPPGVPSGLTVQTNTEPALPGYVWDAP